MDWLKNNYIIGFLVLLVIICFISAVGMSSKLRQKEKLLQGQIALRLQMEEQQQSFISEKAALEKRVNELSKVLDEEKVLHEATKKDLNQERLVVKALKEELEKTVKLKEKLEEDLKESLNKGSLRK